MQVADGHCEYAQQQSMGLTNNMELPGLVIVPAHHAEWSIHYRSACTACSCIAPGVTRSPCCLLVAFATS